MHVLCRAPAVAGTLAGFVIAATVLAARPAQAAYVAVDLYTAAPPVGITQALPSGTSPGAAGGQLVGLGRATSNDSLRALLWTSSGQPIDLTPTQLPNVAGAYAAATDGVRQVGATEGDNGRALLWSGTAASVVQLHPTNLSGFLNSFATGIAGARQVGYGEKANTNNNYHALLWLGTAGSAVDLNPSGYAGSQAFNTDGTRHVGQARGIPFGEERAILWTGDTAASAVDLHPANLLSAAGLIHSGAMGVGGGQQVGYGDNGMGTARHAILWSGTAASAVDLNPTNLPGLNGSSGFATNGIRQVGTAYNTANPQSTHAVLWSGTAASAIDLHALLPATFQTAGARSAALGIDAEGNVFGWAQDAQLRYHAIEWAVPEPSAVALLFLPAWAAGARGLAGRRRRNRTSSSAR
jgi:hypothetical protein